jgi:hypothetical protein
MVFFRGFEPIGRRQQREELCGDAFVIHKRADEAFDANVIWNTFDCHL